MKISENREMLQELERCQADIEKRLKEQFNSGSYNYDILLESMRYSLLAGGKRIRPVICLKFCEAAGGTPSNALDAACAIEMIHTYSLIHDDLPCMDNSDMRRGRPSNHVKYGDFTATLAGDALQAAAFETLLRSDLPSEAVVEMARILAVAAGPHGICGGQYLDVEGVSKPFTVDELTEIDSMKTSALLSAAARIGVVAAGGTQQQISAAEIYAAAVGLAFQIRDDVLDITAMDIDLGKPVGEDHENNKTTFAVVLGVERCEEIIRSETEKAISALNGVFKNPYFLIWLARMLAERTH